MSFRSGLTLAIVVLIGLFTLVNWSTVTAPTSINLLVATVQAPLGVMFLLILGAVVVAYLLLGALAEARALRETRETAKEMERLHRLLEHAEASRIGELRADLSRELAKAQEKLDQILAQRHPGSSGQTGIGGHTRS